MSVVLDKISSMSFMDLIRTLVDAQYYEFFFPFLLLFALYYHVLFRIINKKNKSVLFSKASAILISVIVSFYSITFKFSSGYGISDLMIMMFPNISAISMAILGLYVIGGVLGVDFFKGMFRKDINAYSIFFFGAIAFGSVVYYGGIVLGIWSFDPYDKVSWISVVLSIILLILGIVFLLIGLMAPAFGCLYVAGSFIFNGGTTSFADLLFDPFLFIMFLVITLVSWLSTDKSDIKGQLSQNLKLGEQTIADIEKRYGRKPNQGEDLLYDINTQAYSDNLNRWNKDYGNEDWK